MKWMYQGKEINQIPDEYEGFVYLITNLTNNRKYIGKKLARFKTSKPPLKGKKKSQKRLKRIRLARLLGIVRQIKRRCKKLRPREFFKRNFISMQRQRRNELS